MQLEKNGVNTGSNFERLAQLEPGQAKALKSLVIAASLLNRALFNDATPLYEAAYELAEIAIESFPDSVAGHYILGMARLKRWEDKEFAFEKYKVIVKLGSFLAPELAKIIKEEIGIHNMH